MAIKEVAWQLLLGQARTLGSPRVYEAGDVVQLFPNLR